MTSIFDDPQQEPAARFDSGFTIEEIEAILEEVVDDATNAEWGGDGGLMVALELGLLEGDVIETSVKGTVMVPTPRVEIDRRLAVVRERLAAGASLNEAIESAKRQGP